MADEDDDVEREEFVVPTFLAEIFDERALFDGVSDIVDSRNKNLCHSSCGYR